MSKSHSGGTPATRALEAAGVEFTLRPYTHHDGVTAFGDEVVAELGVEATRVFKTLVVNTGTKAAPTLAVGVVPVAGQLDLKAMAAALGVKKLALADPNLAARSSGYVVGGISPIAHKTPLPTVIDASAEEFATIVVSAGKRGLQVELAAADLAQLTGATFAPIAR